MALTDDLHRPLRPGDIEEARARLSLDAAAEAFARALAHLPDSLPLRSLADRFREELGNGD